MKSYKGTDGSERIWFKPGEIEEIIEDELQKAGLFPSVENPVVELENFIERHLNAKLDQHAALESDLLGVTQFGVGVAPAISINRDLSGAAADMGEASSGSLGRWRATLAHEASHVLLHKTLFEVDERQGSLFEARPGEISKALMRCLKREVSFGASVRDWREVQANMGMAALLMPRATFHALASQFIAERAGARQLEGIAVERAVARLATLLQVSKQAARIRLSTLGYVGGANASLPLEALQGS